VGERVRPLAEETGSGSLSEADGPGQRPFARRAADPRRHDEIVMPASARPCAARRRCV